MAAILETAGLTGLTLYAFIRNASGQIWNGASFESYNVSNWANYDIAVTEQPQSGYYLVSFPAAITEGKYSFVIHQQMGGSPAAGDPVFDRGSINFNGTDEEQGIGIVLKAYRLDDLVLNSSGGTPPTIGSLLDRIMNKNAGQTFDQSTDSLEAIKDTGSGPSAGQIADAVWDEVLDGSHAITDSGAERLKAIDDKLPAGMISDFDENSNNVNLNANQGGVTIGTVNALGTQAKSDVNGEVLDVIAVDTIPELNQAVPASTPTVRTALMLLYMALRNKRQTDSSSGETKIFNSGGGIITKAQISDNGSVFTKEAFVAGP